MSKQNSVFEEIISPVVPLINEIMDTISEDSQKYILSFSPFTINLLFAIINKIPSIGLLITNVHTSEAAIILGLVSASNSMYSEAFHRYSSELFRKILFQLLDKLNFLEIKEIKSLGRFFLVDGSVFPAIKTMVWAGYKKGHNAVKLQLALELNRMTPAHFMVGEGKFSERKFLKQILEKGITYICDRGYIGFNLFKEISLKDAFFIIRGKATMNYEIAESLIVNIPTMFLSFMSDVKDVKIIFKNDKNKMTYRIITFMACGEFYVLITNRFDLTTYEVIMLYAYRWQIELIFRLLKRTLNGIHLWSHNPNGVEVQFHLYMIAYLLLLSFKQNCALKNDEARKEENGLTEDAEEVSVCSGKFRDPIISKRGRPYVRGIVSLLGNRLRRYWKFGIHWLTKVRNILLATFDLDAIRILATE